MRSLTSMTDYLLCLVSFLAFVVTIKGQCTGQADIVIAVPGSDDIPRFEFDTFEDQLTELLRHFDISKTEINIGLVLYGKTQIRVASPQPFKTKKELNTRITLLHRRNKYSHELSLEADVAGAIYAVHLMLLNPPAYYPREILRPNSRKIGVIFTYGTGDESNQAQIQLNIIAAAEAAHRDGILLYALSANGTVPGFSYIGNDNCRLFSMKWFSEGLARAVPDLASGICSELDPLEQVTPPDNCFPKRYGKDRKVHVSCISDSVIVGDPTNCAYFYRCEFRNPVRYECATDTLYDANLRTCNFAQFVECYSDVGCPAAYGLYPHPFDCTKFINCFNSTAYVQNCALGNLFDEMHGACNLTRHVYCPPYKRMGRVVP